MQNTETSARMAAAAKASESNGQPSLMEMDNALTEFISANHPLLDTMGITNSDVFPLKPGMNPAKKVPVVATVLSKSSSKRGKHRLTINWVDTIPVHELLTLRPEMPEMWRNLQSQSAQRKGCVGFTVVMLNCGPILKTIPIMLTGELRNVPLKHVADLIGWADILNEAASGQLAF